MTDILAPVHPGILIAEFINQIRISKYRLAKEIGMTPSAISDIINGKRSVTADVCLRLGIFTGTSAQMWMDLQSRYDLHIAKIARKSSLSKQIKPWQEALG